MVIVVGVVVDRSGIVLWDVGKVLLLLLVAVDDDDDDDEDDDDCVNAIDLTRSHCNNNTNTL